MVFMLPLDIHPVQTCQKLNITCLQAPPKLASQHEYTTFLKMTFTNFVS